jgi:hypothetical protein
MCRVPGMPEWGHRVPGAVAGAATVALLADLAETWWVGAGWPAGVILAFAPVFVRYSQEVRPYAFGLLFLVAALWSLERFASTRIVVFAAAWFASVLLACYSLYFAGLVAVIASTARIYEGRHGTLGGLWRRLPLVAAALAAGYAPWLGVLSRLARSAPVVAREPLTSAWVKYRLQTLATGDWRAEPVSLGSWLFWIVVAAGILRAARRRRMIAAVAWFCGGTIAELVVLRFHPHFPAIRHLLPACLGAYLLFGAALAGRRPGVVAAAVATIVLFDARTLAAFYAMPHVEWNRVAHYVSRDRARGEVLLAANDWTARNLGFYLGGKPVSVVPPGPAELRGPGWLVVSECPGADPASLVKQGLSLRRRFEETNHCSVYHFSGKVRLPAGICRTD